MPVLESEYSEYLFAIAQCYLGLGYSVLPVYGDCDLQRAKVCPIQWTYFQTHRPTKADLRQWFIQSGYGGVAIVCGRISGIAILDFDDEALAQEFSRQHADLIDTWTVQSGGRKLPHYYYRLPLHTAAPSQKRQGVDFQSGGRYVVAPPTIIAGGEWQVVCGKQPLMLTERDLRRIASFLHSQTPESPENGANPSVFAFEGLFRAQTALAASQQPVTIACGAEQIATRIETPSLSSTTAKRGSETSLDSHYRKMAGAGRNQALFETAIWARDHGWHENEVKHCLVESHAKTPSSQGRSPETPEQRRREAVRTVESAFSRPPRTGKAKQTRFISNTLRETLLQRKETAALRVLEALTLAGWEPGRVFTEREAREAAHTYAVGEWSVRKALKESGFFSHPPNDAAKNANTAINTDNAEYKKCFFVTESKPQKNNRRGRQNHYYVMPDPQTLCERYQLPPSYGDRLVAEDLRSCRAYRQAVLRELIKRRPGMYSRDWLADLLGVSAATTRRYTQDVVFNVTPSYHDSPLLWRNLDTLVPADVHDARPGSFLEDSDGKRYPPMLAIAQRLLRKSRFVWFKWREVNHYGYANTDASPPPETERSLTNSVLDLTNAVPVKEFHHAPEEQMVLTNPRPLDKPAKPPPDYSQPLDDLRREEAARRIYDSIDPSNSTHRLSMANARALVVKYGSSAVENAIETAKNRAGIRNPVGFVAQLLESQYGPKTDESLTIAELYAAELAFAVTREINPGHALNWENACNLARQYGQVAIENAIKILRQRKVKNPAGFLVKLLRSEPALACVSHNPLSDEEFCEHVYTTIRQMNAQHALSRNIIRRLVSACGRTAVEDGLHLIQQRGNIQNPAGFLVTVLRANHIVRKSPQQGRGRDNSL